MQIVTNFDSWENADILYEISQNTLMIYTKSLDDDDAVGTIEGGNCFDLEHCGRMLEKYMNDSGFKYTMKSDYDCFIPGNGPYQIIAHVTFTFEDENDLLFFKMKYL